MVNIGDIIREITRKIVNNKLKNFPCLNLLFITRPTRKIKIYERITIILRQSRYVIKKNVDTKIPKNNLQKISYLSLYKNKAGIKNKINPEEQKKQSLILEIRKLIVIEFNCVVTNKRLFVDNSLFNRGTLIIRTIIIAKINL